MTLPYKKGFQPRPYDPDRENKQTPAQQLATMRNFGIFKLRGLHAQMRMLTGPRRELAEMLVDQELIARGALPMAERDAQAWAKARKREHRYHSKGLCAECKKPWNDCTCDIPF